MHSISGSVAAVLAGISLCSGCSYIKPHPRIVPGTDISIPQAPLGVEALTRMVACQLTDSVKSSPGHNCESGFGRDTASHGTSPTPPGRPRP
jgi:hypothetical protein